MADALPGNWPRFWNGNIKALTGIAHIDGSSYIFMGAPGNIGATQMMTQTNLTVTSTKSIFTLQGAGVYTYCHLPIACGGERYPEVIDTSEQHLCSCTEQ